MVQDSAEHSQLPAGDVKGVAVEDPLHHLVTAWGSQGPCVAVVGTRLAVLDQLHHLEKHDKLIFTTRLG